MNQDDDFALISERWRQKTFANGAIGTAQLKDATIELVRAWFFKDFQSWADQGVVRALGRAPGPTWWVGLNAFSEAFGRELVAGIAQHTPSAASVTFEVWGRMIYANARASVGSLSNGTDLPANWHEDPVFAAAWAKAVQNRLGNERLLTMFTLALHWDTFRIPLRYFTDTAALAFLRVALFRLPSVHLQLDTYRKDIRGNRGDASGKGGLHLKAPSGDHVVVRWSARSPHVFRVSIKAATRLGLSTDGFESPIPGVKDRLIFEPH